MADRILTENALATTRIDDDRGIVSLIRKDSPMDLEILRASREIIVKELPLHRRAHCTLLFDMRLAPLASPKAEGPLLQFAGEIQRGFIGWATVISTAIGQLQASRMRREGKMVQGFVTTNVDEAVHHLMKLVHDHRNSSRPPARS